MGILPDAALWQSLRPTTPGKQLETSPTPKSNASPQFSACSERPRGKRLILEAAAHKHEVCLGTDSCTNTLVRRLPRGVSEPSIVSAEELQALPAAGCRQARISELRSERKLGRRKSGVEPAYVESDGNIHGIDRVHEFRFYMEPSQKRFGTKPSVEERDSKPRPCAEHRYYHEVGHDHIEGLRNPGHAKGLRDSNMGDVLRDRDECKSEIAPSQESSRKREPLRSPAETQKKDLRKSPSTNPFGFEPRVRRQGTPVNKATPRSASSSSLCCTSEAQSNALGKSPLNSEASRRSAPSPSSALRVKSIPGGSSKMRSVCSMSSLASGSTLTSVPSAAKIPNRPISRAQIAGLLTPTDTSVSGFSPTSSCHTKCLGSAAESNLQSVS